MDRPVAVPPKAVPISTGDEDDLIVGQANESPPLLPEGEHRVAFVRPSRGRFLGRERIFLWFRIIEAGEHFGEEVYLVCPLPEHGKRFGIGSKFFKAWCLAAGRKPTPRERLSTRVFKGKVYRVEVKTVKKDQDGRDKPAHEHYSKIDRLICVEAGANA